MIFYKDKNQVVNEKIDLVFSPTIINGSILETTMDENISTIIDYKSPNCVVETLPKVEEILNSPFEKMDYVNVIKKVKKENITPNNIGEIMLCQIPGISSITALAIMSQYKSISNLIKELELNNESMKDLSYKNEKGQTRKINKTCIANIVKFLLKK